MHSEPLDILAGLPESFVGRHTKWLWSRLLAIAGGGQSLRAAEIEQHFAPSVLAHVPAEHLATHFTQLASAMSRVIRLVEESSSDERYSALLELPDCWLRYSCAAQDTPPHLLIEAAYALAIDPNTYSDRRVQHDGRDVRFRDFGGSGPLLLLWHGAGGDLSCWETLVPFLTGFHVVAQDLPGHGRSPLPAFKVCDALADAEAVIAELDAGPPFVVGHSLGGYLALRYAATHRCLGWIGLDGPFAIVYPWEKEDSGASETVVQIGREIRNMDVVRDFAARSCPAMLILCGVAVSQIEAAMVSARREIAAHLERHHPEVQVEWVQMGHDAMLFHDVENTAARIRDFFLSFPGQTQTGQMGK